MNTLLSLLVMISQNTLEDTTSANIAKYIIGHMDEMKDINIKILASKCYTSTTSILRFCRLLGFQKFSKFKNILLGTYNVRIEQLKDKLKDTTEKLILSHMQAIADKPFDEAALLNYIDELILLIQKEKVIYFYGSTFCLALTTSFGEDMLVMGTPVFVHQSPFYQDTIEKKKGLHIIVTLSGRYLQLKKGEYLEMLSMNQPVVLISKITSENGNSLSIPLPHTHCSDDDEIMFLLLLNLIKYKYYNKIKNED